MGFGVIMEFRVSCWPAALALSALLALGLVLVAPGAVRDASAAACPASVTTEAQLVDCINEYNAASGATTTTITLGANISLAAALPSIDNATSAELELLGSGFTIDLEGNTGDVLHQTAGTSTIREVTLTGGTDDGIEVAGGGAVMIASTSTGNGDGAFVAGGTLRIENSTIASNSDDGIAVNGAAEVAQSTIVDNGRRGISNFGSSSIIGSVVARNATDCFATAVSDLGGSVFGDGSCNGTVTAGLAASLAAGLAPNGCTAPCTETVALLAGSPAIDVAGSCGFAVDQRGIARLAGFCDAGAFEAPEATPPTVTIISPADGAVFVRDEVVLADYSCVDEPEGSGIDTCTGNVADGAAIDTSTLGAHSFTVTGTDNAGNVAAATHDYSVVRPPCAGLVTTEPQLADCVVEYNGAAAGTTTTVTLGADIGLSELLPDVNNATTAKLTIDGGGHTIDLNSNGRHVLRQFGGDSTLRHVTLTGSNDGGVTLVGGVSVLIGSTSTGNTTGAVIFGGTLKIENSTIASNENTGLFISDGVVEIAHSTIVDNGGVGIFNFGAVSLGGSVVARNATDCSGGFSDLGGNVFGDASCTGSATVGLAASLAAGPPAPNGCTAPCTATVALLANSPAIDVAGDCAAQFPTDQRGEFRPVGAGCDSGAFEFQLPDEFCDGKLVTINMNFNGGIGIGTGAADVILGRPVADRINGSGGDDTICAGDGDDTIRGGAGADTIFGDSGADTIRGGGGADIIDGGTGDDTILGQAGLDTIDGGPGNDTIDGQGAADTVDGGTGDDTINGQNGADIMRGSAGNDTIKGQTGPDEIRGDDDDDDLGGGNGNDTLFGGAGFDKCAGNTGNGDQAEAATCEQTPGVETLF